MCIRTGEGILLHTVQLFFVFYQNNTCQKLFTPRVRTCITTNH